MIEVDLRSSRSTIREKLIEEFSIDSDMRIIEDCAYNGEMIYVPYFHALVQSRELSFAKTDGTFGFIITDKDRAIFPELGDAEKVLIAVRTDSRLENYIEGWLE